MHHPIDTADVRALALAVIHAAVIDATYPPRPNTEALNFLTDTAGAWAKSFDTWCGVAGIDPAWARQKCGELILARISAGTRFGPRSNARASNGWRNPRTPTHDGAN